MNTDKLKESAQEAKQAAKDFISSPQVQNTIEKGKKLAGDAVDKLEDFIEEKTDGKGILGFGAKK